MGIESARGPTTAPLPTLYAHPLVSLRRWARRCTWTDVRQPSAGSCMDREVERRGERWKDGGIERKMRERVGA